MQVGEELLPSVPDGRGLVAPLIDANAQFDRYRPRGFKASMMAVYQLWNLLDRYNFETLHNTSLPWIYGYLREVQVEALVHAVQQKGVRRYCEVGFNGGHSAVAVLASAPEVNVISFDNAAYGRHTRHNAGQIQRWFPNRFNFVEGDSRNTLPLMIHRIRNGLEPSCDVILVDGSHKELEVLRDLYHMHKASSCRAPVFVDDLDGGPGKAVLSVAKEGKFMMKQWFLYDSRPMPPSQARVEAEKRNITYVLDPSRTLNPCLRFYFHGRAIGKECYETWDAKKCRLCLPTFEWGIGQYQLPHCHP